MWRCIVPLAAVLLVTTPVGSAAAIPCGVGVDMVDLLWRRTSTGGRWDANGTAATRAMLQDAAKYGFTYARVAASPFWPVDLRQVHNATFWPTLDSVVDDAASTGVALGLTLAWNMWAFVDVCSEHMGDLVRDPSSCSQRLLRNYTTAVVSRYSRNPTVAYFELANELNLLVDLNMTGQPAGCAPALGTPAARTSADNFSTADMVAFTTTYAGWIRDADPLHRAVSSGHSLPRAQAWHLRNSYHSPSRDWSADSPQQFSDVLRAVNGMVDMGSVHIYNHSTTRWSNTNASDPALVVHTAKAALAGTGTQLYVGEYGDHRSSPARTFTRAMLDTLVNASVTASTLWVWEMKGQADTFAVYPHRDASIVAAMQAANAAMPCPHWPNATTLTWL